jgi:hypothetical protein
MGFQKLDTSFLGFQALTGFQLISLVALVEKPVKTIFLEY